MASFMRRFTEFLKQFPHVAVLEVTEAKGSTPREEGAWMLVSPTSTLGTIGGGQLEFLAIAKARELIDSNLKHGTLSVPLGPEIGQCCGGRVALDIRLADQQERANLTERVKEAHQRRPHIYLFGAGHVGKALAAALSHLPFRIFLVDTRPDTLEEIPPDVQPVPIAMPEVLVREAPPASAFVILTHDHALDFLITREALARRDASYVGMIGSKTKKATFHNWLLREGGSEEDFARLVSPIGGHSVPDKRPEVIAALAAAEIVRAVLLAAE